MRDIETINLKKIGRFRLRKLIFIVIFLGFFLSAIWSCFYNVPLYPPLTITPPNKTPIIPHWKLVFDDEFSETSINTNKWTVINANPLDYGLQFYTPQAVAISDGVLQIKVDKNNMGGYNYTSGGITTEDKFSFLYGRVDVRAKLPDTQAVWPAIWLLPNNTRGIASFEIDIMELLGQNPTVAHMTNHWGKNQVYATYQGPNFSQGYHVFSVIWTPEDIIWYIDGIEVFYTSQGISNEPMHLIINTAIGGDWPGKPDSRTILPQYMNISSVRIYQVTSNNSN